MPYRLRNARPHYRWVDKRIEPVRNIALAANMRKLRAGRSIGDLRAEMAKKGIKIGAGTLHRAIKGEVSNRLESLGKIAEFFEITIDQLLQFEGVDETYWPFSAELQQKVLALSTPEIERLEGVMRAHLGMSGNGAVFTAEHQNGSGAKAAVAYPVAQEVGTRALDQAELPEPKQHGKRGKDRGQQRGQGGGRA